LRVTADFREQAGALAPVAEPEKAAGVKEKVTAKEREVVD